MHERSVFIEPLNNVCTKGADLQGAGDGFEPALLWAEIAVILLAQHCHSDHQQAGNPMFDSRRCCLNPWKPPSGPSI